MDANILLQVVRDRMEYLQGDQLSVEERFKVTNELVGTFYDLDAAIRGGELPTEWQPIEIKKGQPVLVHFGEHEVKAVVQRVGRTGQIYLVSDTFTALAVERHQINAQNLPLWVELLPQ